MDLDANMERQIELAREIVTINGRDEDNPSTQAAVAVYWLGVQLAELILKQEREFTLIAAAPELLDALRELAALCESADPGFYDLTDANRAIAKAEGREA